jgi:hypothetical protein
VHAQISLPVAIKIERAKPNRALDRLFKDPGIDCLAFVDREPWPRDVQRNNFRHSSNCVDLSLHRHENFDVPDREMFQIPCVLEFVQRQTRCGLLNFQSFYKITGLLPEHSHVLRNTEIWDTRRRNQKSFRTELTSFLL